MKIRQKLLLAFLVIASLVGVVGYISITTSQEALKDSVGEAALRLASRTLHELDQRIFGRAEELQAFAKDLSLGKKAAASNAQFDKIPNVQAHIRKIDKDWIEKKDSPFIQGILSNELSSTLTKHIEFYKQKYGYAVIAEMYVTNRYGVVIGSTGRTSDYLQADEGWYQRAVAEKGFWVGEVEYDESSKSFAIDIVVNLYDNDGNFVGIVKGVLNLEDIRRTIDEMQARSQYRSMQPYLVDRKGLLVFSGLDSSHRKLGRDIRLEEFGKDLSSRRAVIQASQGNEGFSVGTEEGKQKLVVFSHSKGFREFRGLDWSLVVDFDTREILGEVIEVRDILFIVSLILVVVAGVIGLFISRSISKPIVQLSEMTEEIGKGNLDKRVDIKSKDEIGVLASSFNQMVGNLEKEINERKRAQEEIALKNRDLEALLYVTSHDLREPLRSIEVFSHMVNDRYAERLDKKGQDFLVRVVRGAQRMGRLLDDILELSRVKLMEQPIQGVKGETIVGEALRQLEGKINETGAKVRVGKDLPKLLAERMWATQALYNLIANALKFTRDGEAPEVEIVRYQGDGEVGLVVRDRGRGVLPEHAGRIFQLFQRAVGREVEGTGAGLAIVRQVAEQHGGRAWVEPREGGGSEFIVTFGKPDILERG